MASIGAICGSFTKPPNGNGAEAVNHAIVGPFPQRFAEPDGELFDHQPAPPRREEMAEFVHDDQQVEQIRTTSKQDEDDLQER